MYTLINININIKNTCLVLSTVGPSNAVKTPLTSQDMHKGPLRVSYGNWNWGKGSGSFGSYDVGAWAFVPSHSHKCWIWLQSRNFEARSMLLAQCHVSQTIPG